MDRALELIRNLSAPGGGRRGGGQAGEAAGHPGPDRLRAQFDGLERRPAQVEPLAAEGRFLFRRRGWRGSRGPRRAARSRRSAPEGRQIVQWDILASGIRGRDADSEAEAVDRPLSAPDLAHEIRLSWTCGSTRMRILDRIPRHGRPRLLPDRLSCPESWNSPAGRSTAVHLFESAVRFGTSRTTLERSPVCTLLIQTLDARGASFPAAATFADESFLRLLDLRGASGPRCSRTSRTSLRARSPGDPRLQRQHPSRPEPVRPADQRVQPRRPIT